MGARDPEALRHSLAMLPQICSSSEVYGKCQDAALAACPSRAISVINRRRWSAKRASTRRSEEHLRHRLLPADEHRQQNRCNRSTAAHHAGLQAGQKPAHYALEGSIAITGALVQWMRDNLGMIRRAPRSKLWRSTEKDNGGVYFVPAFSGLYAPYWKTSARGVIAGLTRYVNKGHIARAVLEATAFQTREVVEAMQNDSGIDLDVLRTDGGMVENELLMQFQADILNKPGGSPGDQGDDGAWARLTPRAWRSAFTRISRSS